ncbi:uncharacterized protein K02A2.6 [Trichonephila clavipes]|nr:uncharacterized protein K02A2.6 [Trichonephila clavipes]
MRLILQSFEFDIIFRKTIEHGNADFLSRLPKTSEELEVKDDITIFQMSQIEALSRLLLRSYDRRRVKILVELGPLLRALRKVKICKGGKPSIPLRMVVLCTDKGSVFQGNFRKNVLEELHAETNLGIVKMKAIARSFVYWKNIDNDIEEAAKTVSIVLDIRLILQNLKFITGNILSMPWERIHVDFAGITLEHTFFLIVDAHSKWLEVYPMKVTTTKKPSNVFEIVLQDSGLPSNGQAERYVATLEQSLRAMHSTKDKLRRDNFEFEIGNLLEISGCEFTRAANTKMEVWYHSNQDGVLHYIIDVQGTLVRRHVDQIRPVGDKSTKKNIVPLYAQRFPSSEVRETTLIFSMQKRRKIFLRIGTRNWVHLPYKGAIN